MKDIRKTCTAAGIRFTRINGAVTLVQQAYVKRQAMLDRFQMAEGNPVSNLINASAKLTKRMCPSVAVEKGRVQKSFRTSNV